jgi:hypothetical protein
MGNRRQWVVLTAAGRDELHSRDDGGAAADWEQRRQQAGSNGQVESVCVYVCVCVCVWRASGRNEPSMSVGNSAAMRNEKMQRGR